MEMRHEAAGHAVACHGRQLPLVARNSVPYGYPAGFFLADAVMALVILSLLAGVLVMGAGRQRHASLRLKDQRAAAALVERALSRMRAGVAVNDATIQVEPLADGDAPPGQGWVRVTAMVHGREATVVGLAPVGKGVGHE